MSIFMGIFSITDTQETGLWLVTAVLSALTAWIYFYVQKRFVRASFTPEGLLLHYPMSLHRPKLRIAYDQIRQIEFDKEPVRGGYFFHAILHTDQQPIRITTQTLKDIQPLVSLVRAAAQQADLSDAPIALAHPFLSKRDLVYDPKQRFQRTLMPIIGMMLVVNSCSFLISGLGITRDRDQYETHYDGSSSFTELPVYFKPLAIQSVPDVWNEKLAFGFLLDDVKVLKVKYLESSIDTGRIEHLFVRLDKYSHFSLHQDSTYYALLDIRANFWTYPFTSQKAFEIYYLEQVPTNLTPAPLPKDDWWQAKLLFYCLLTHVQFNCFFLFWMVTGYSSTVQPAPDVWEFRKSGAALRALLWVALSFGGATAYKIYIDMPFFVDVVDWGWAGFLVVTTLFYGYKTWQVYQNSRDFVRFTTTHFEFRDNERTGKYRYEELKNIGLVGQFDENGEPTHAGTLIFHHQKQVVKLSLDALNLGECDMEIFEMLRQRVPKD